jgi:hypothetical protein
MMRLRTLLGDYAMTAALKKGAVASPQVEFDFAQVTPVSSAFKRTVRAYTVTTATWLRGILADDYGVDTGKVRWVTFEDAHVAEFRDPPNVERAPAGSNLVTMLLESKRAAGLPAPGTIDTNPCGLAANRRNLEVAIDCVYRQGMIPRRFAVDELFDDVTRGLG